MKPSSTPQPATMQTNKWRSLLTVVLCDLVLAVFLEWIAPTKQNGQIAGTFMALCILIAFAVSPRRDILLGLRAIDIKEWAMIGVVSIWVGGVGLFMKGNIPESLTIASIALHWFTIFLLFFRTRSNREKS